MEAFAACEDGKAYEQPAEHMFNEISELFQFHGNRCVGARLCGTCYGCVHQLIPTTPRCLTLSSY